MQSVHLKQRLFQFDLKSKMGKFRHIILLIFVVICFEIATSKTEMYEDSVEDQDQQKHHGDSDEHVKQKQQVESDEQGDQVEQADQEEHTEENEQEEQTEQVEQEESEEQEEQIEPEEQQSQTKQVEQQECTCILYYLCDPEYWTKGRSAHCRNMHHCCTFVDTERVTEYLTEYDVTESPEILEKTL